MNRMLKGFFPLAMLVASALSLADCNSNTTGCNSNCNGNAYFSIRSQSVNAARELAGWQPYINLFDRDCFYGSFTITPEYTRSFRACHIAEFLFGADLQNVPFSTTAGTAATSCNTSCNNDNCGSLVISGSQVANRGAKDWLADYFGLSPAFQSVVNFKPRISNFLVDFNLYLGLDEWASGLYFRIHAPVVYTRWNLRASENVINAGLVSGTGVGYNAGYMSSAAILQTSLRQSFLQAMNGTYTFGDMSQPLQYGIISNGSTCNNTTVNTTTNCNNNNNDCGSSHKKTRLSDVEAALGWNFWQCEDYHFGLQIRGSAPAGNRPEAVFLFEPIVGNGHHWMFGGGISSHAVLWRGCDEDRYFGVWMDVNIEHLFKTKQKRSFDFVNRPNSRYVLLEQMTSTISNGLLSATTACASGTSPVPAGTAPNAQYAGVLLPAINVTTLDVNVSIAVQADFVLKFAYISNNFEVDLGYNLWARSGEKFSSKCDPIITEKKYAIKGDAQVYGFCPVGSTTAGAAIALSATEDTATIHVGTNNNFTAGSTYTTNPNVDNAQFAIGNCGTTPASTCLVANPLNAPSPTTQILTSNPAVFVTSTDINLAKTPSALSNKVFGSLSYGWNDCEDWIPFLSLGGEVEFDGRNNDCRAALSQWGIWLKGGISFN